MSAGYAQLETTEEIFPLLFSYLRNENSIKKTIGIHKHIAESPWYNVSELISYEKTHPAFKNIINKEPREPLILSPAISATYMGMLIITPLQPIPTMTLAMSNHQTFCAVEITIQLTMKSSILAPNKKKVPQRDPMKLIEPTHEMNSVDMGSVPTGALSEERSGCIGDVQPSIVPIENADRLAATETVQSQAYG
ncbi:hypothetical protein J6590_050821 [Homalodisca vitripennis]|nr:hypothetical protein J6590_050821 [Homalodisca vitripennis]